MTNNQRFDLIVIGSGLAGSQAALLAAKRGLKVGLVEESELGGDSLNYSDLPLSQLTMVARHLYQTKHHLPSLGINHGLVSFNYSKILHNVNQIIAKANATNLNLYQRYRIELLAGRAYFISPQCLSVNQQHLTANHFILATGASWIMPQIVGLDQTEIRSPRQLFNLYQLPGRMLIIGGHSSAVVLSQIFASFGVKVDLICPTSKLIPEFNQHINQELTRALSRYFNITISTNSQVLEVTKRHQIKQVLFSHAGIERRMEVDEIIIAQKLQPDLDYGLSNAAVLASPEGVITDHFLRTSNKQIFAAGDVLGGNNNPNVTLAEASLATMNMLGRPFTSAQYFTQPDVIEAVFPLARVSSTTIKTNKHRTISVSFREAPRQLVEPFDQPGLLTLTTDQQQHLVEAECFGPEADIVIYQLAPLVKRQAPIHQLLELATSFLSWQEIINLAANKLIK